MKAKEKYSPKQQITNIEVGAYAIIEALDELTLAINKLRLGLSK